MHALIEVIFPVFLVIGFGYAAVWAGFFSTESVDGLMRFTQNFAIPCLLFGAIASLDLSQVFDFALLFSFYSGATVCFLAGLFGARLLFQRPWEDCVAIGFCCLFSNSLMLGLAITERAYGTAALTSNYAIVALHAPFLLLPWHLNHGNCTQPAEIGLARCKKRFYRHVQKRPFSGHFGRLCRQFSKGSASQPCHRGR